MAKLNGESLKNFFIFHVEKIVLGVVIWWRGDGALFAALQRIPPGRIYWGVMELAFYFACMVPYAAMWRMPRLRWLNRVLAVAAATNLMYHFPSLMLIYARIVSGRLQLDEAVDPAMYRQLAFGGDVLAGTVHFWSASFVATGITACAGDEPPHVGPRACAGERGAPERRRRALRRS